MVTIKGVSRSGVVISSSIVISVGYGDVPIPLLTPSTTPRRHTVTNDRRRSPMSPHVIVKPTDLRRASDKVTVPAELASFMVSTVVTRVVIIDEGELKVRISIRTSGAVVKVDPMPHGVGVEIPMHVSSLAICVRERDSVSPT